MDTIVTPVTVITLDSTRIVHSIKADLVARYFPPVVRLVQYDQSLPVIAVSLMQNGQTYTLPSGAAANIRVHKPDATYVYNPALGCDSTRNIVYFEVTQAMAAANGDGLAIVEIVVDGDIAGTSLITLHFEENPVPEDAIESSDEWETIYELGERIIASTVTPVSTAAGMTDHNVVYLYTGTESGWNQGHMYYYNGTAWVDAGIAVTDTTLSVAGLAADAKKTGDEIATLKDGFNGLKNDLNTLICPNLAGSEVGKDYPVYIPAGTQMTISTSDGSIFPTTSTLRILLKNAEGVQTDYFTIKTGQPTKTFTVSSTREDVYYLAWNETPSVPLMVNIGGTALPYVEYFTSVSSRVVGNLPNLETADSANLVSAINDSLPRRGIVYPSDYSNLISHITTSGKYQIQDRNSSEKWTDYPTGASAGALITYRYGASYVLQVFYAYNGDVKTAHYRIVNRTDYTNYIDWTPLSLMWKHNLTASDNLNNITAEGVYRWPNVAATPQNAPFQLNAFLFVLGNLPSTNCVQICFSSILSDTANIAIRVSQSTNTVWTPWVYPYLSTDPKKFDTAIVYQNSLTSSDDLNNVVKNGIYNYSDLNIPSHAPATGKGGIIQVIGSASTTTQKLQIYTGYGVDPSNLNGDRLQTAYRALGASVWSEWRYVRTGISPLTQRLEGKRISILGDSISTYAGYVPTGTGYASYYDGTNCGVTSVDQTWWKRLIDETGLILCKNNSVSGSCMSTGARQDRISGCLPERTGALTDESGNKPDYIIVYMGMNDFVNNVEIGTYDGFGNIPSDVTIFRNAYATALLAIMTNYPNAKIFVCTTHHTEYNTTSQKIQIKGSNITQAEFNEQIRELARIFCLDVIDFEHCGITTGNITSCTGDNVESGGTLGRGLHPNAKGHELLFREALKTFNALRQ